MPHYGFCPLANNAFELRIALITPTHKAIRRTTHPRKTEYEIETKETMQREQKVIVLRTEGYCTYCVKNKGGIIS